MSTVKWENTPSTNTPLNETNLNLMNYRPHGGGLILNGDFQLWQRGTSFISPNNQYTADRWIISNNIDTNVDITQVSSLEDGHEFALRMEANAAGAAGAASYLRQRINKPTLYSNQTFTLQVRINVDSGINARIAIIKDNTTILKSLNINGTGNIQTYEITKLDTLTISTQFEVEVKLFRDTGTLIGDGLTIQWVKLEKGEVATPFEPKTVEEVKNDCYPYFERINGNDLDSICNAYAQTTTQSRGVIYHQYKIDIPTITVSNNEDIEFLSGALYANTGFGVSNQLLDRAAITLTNTGLTTGQAGLIRFATNNAYIDIDAEL